MGELGFRFDDERQVVVVTLDGEACAEWTFEHARLLALWLIDGTSPAAMFSRELMKRDKDAPRPISRLDTH
jgi:hypothetical protein